ncbi:caspase family protein [Mesorhizobium sp. VNQ89]|uniref:caspase family protein n=1 Tax=Mesorhizobium quangtriensis TaxID=3157709 RepID=UPI0032B75DAA
MARFSPALFAWLVLAGLQFAISPAGAGVVVLGEKEQAEQQKAVEEEAQAAELERVERLAAFETMKAELAKLPSVASVTASSGKRHAFVVGNDDYEAISKLFKAVGDATSVSAALKQLGFQVTTQKNLGRDDFDDALEAFYETLQEGDVAVFYYSGHGIAVDGANYLLPVDMPEVDPDDERKIRREGIDANEVVQTLAARGVQLALVVLDACRDDPFARDGTRSAASLRGLAPITPNKGVFVIYSAGIGEKALDRLSDADPDPNSIFTRKFMPILETPGLPLVDIAKRTQVEVRELAQQARHKQAPAYYDQVIGQYYFQPPRPKLYGITIGIDKYAGISLRGAVNDAERIARSLESLGAEKVVRMFDHDARLPFIEYVWRDMVEDASPGDTIVFSYAGSSAQVPTTSKEDEPDGLDEVLLLAEVDMRQAKEGLIDEERSGSLIYDNKLTEWMKMASDKNVNVVLLVDGCHGGGLLDREFANVSFVGASAEDELVMEYKVDGRSHGLASVAFAQGVEGAADYNGDGFVAQRELFHYVSDSVFRNAKRKQTPEFLPAVKGLPTVQAVSASSSSNSATDLPLFKLPADLAGKVEASLAAPFPNEPSR